ncbi:MAG: pentapeptide repeat-containing protein [Myxococcota bacterium]
MPARSSLCLALVAGLCLPSALAWTATYELTDGEVEEILDRDGAPHSYSGTDLAPDVYTLDADLQNAALPDAALEGAVLEGANLQSADLSRADLDFGDLFGANLTNAILDAASLDTAVLNDCDLEGASLVGANLNDADFAPFDGSTQLKDANFTDALMALGYLNYVKAHGTNFTRANLREATLFSGEFRSANFTDADLTGVDGVLADFLSATVTGADFSAADLAEATNLGTTTGAAYYDDLTSFDYTGFDPVAAGWILSPEPGAALLAAAMLMALGGHARRRQRSLILRDIRG